MESICKVLYPEQFQSNRIFTHSEFEQELKDVLERSGYKQKFISMFRQRMKFLEDNWYQCNRKRDWFEILKKTDGLYSIKFKGQKNIRIIFKFIGYKNRDIALLLCIFEEKNSKNNYKEAIHIAQKRLSDINNLID